MISSSSFPWVTILKITKSSSFMKYKLQAHNIEMQGIVCESV